MEVVRYDSSRFASNAKCDATLRVPEKALCRSNPDMRRQLDATRRCAGYSTLGEGRQPWRPGRAYLRRWSLIRDRVSKEDSTNAAYSRSKASSPSRIASVIRILRSELAAGCWSSRVSSLVIVMIRPMQLNAGAKLKNTIVVKVVLNQGNRCQGSSSSSSLSYGQRPVRAIA